MLDLSKIREKFLAKIEEAKEVNEACEWTGDRPDTLASTKQLAWEQALALIEEHELTYCHANGCLELADKNKEGFCFYCGTYSDD